jgi:hypothetical protein
MTRSEQGFAYLWVLLLVAFLGVSLMAIVQVDATLAQRDKERELLAIGRQFRQALGRYHAVKAQGGRPEYPQSLDDLLRDPRSPGTVRHLRRIFVDPMTGKAEWGLVRVAGRIVGVHSLSSRTPIKQDGFEAEDAGLRGKRAYSDWAFTYPADLLLRAEEVPQPPAAAASAASQPG